MSVSGVQEYFGHSYDFGSYHIRLNHFLNMDAQLSSGTFYLNSVLDFMCTLHASIQSQTTNGPPAKRQVNCVSLEG